MGGASVPTLNRNNLDNLPVDIPPIQEQVRIASILSSYDDLIENNLRRIDLLEKSTRLLYEEWFVHLRFPGHEHTNILVAHPMGGSEKDWLPLLYINMGQSPESKILQ